MFETGHFNRIGQGKLPGTLGIAITHVSEVEVVGELAIVEALMAPNGYLHAGSVISLADTCAGYGCVRNLPSGIANRAARSHCFAVRR